MAEGVVKWYDAAKGTGVIETETQEELPVHRSALRDEAMQGLHAGDVVAFRPGRNKFGRRAALDVRRIGWIEDEGEDSDVPREWTF